MQTEVTYIFSIMKKTAISLLYRSFSYLYISSTLTDALPERSASDVGTERTAQNCGVERRQKERKMAKEQRRGNREICEAKAVKSAGAA